MKNDKTEITDARGEEIAMLGAAIATDKLAPVLEQNVKDISEITQATSVVIEKQDRAEENAIIRANETNNRVERTLTYRQFCYALTFMFVVLVLVLTGAGKLVRGNYWFEGDSPQVRRLSDENNRLDNEVNMLRQKIGFRNETILIYRGITQDNSRWLELSRVEHRGRDEPFEFVDWYAPDDAVEYMIKAEAWDCLDWVMRQPQWYSCLHIKTYNRIMAIKDGPKKNTPISQMTSIEKRKHFRGRNGRNGHGE